METKKAVKSIAYGKILPLIDNILRSYRLFRFLCFLSVFFMRFRAFLV